MPNILITGGHGELAQAIACEFLRFNCTVLTPGREELNLSVETKEQKLYSHILTYLKKQAPCDLLIANAGITRDALFAKLSASDFAESILVNLTAAKCCAEAAAELAHNQNRKLHVIFIGSFSGIHPNIGQNAYATSKSALLGLTQTFAQNWGKFGTRVNLIFPGFLMTKLTKNLPSSVLEKALNRHALTKFTTPEETARFIRFLHLEMPSVSGQLFNLDSRILSSY